MSGFSDQDVVKTYTGATKFLYAAPSDYRFRVVLPQFGGTDLWGADSTKIVVVSPAGVIAELTVDDDPDSEGFWDEGGYLWIKPVIVTDWATDLSAWEIYLLYRPAIEQLIDVTGLPDFDPVADAAQLDRTTRIAQIAFEMARRSVLQRPSEFSGREAGTLLLPPLADLEGKLIGVDEDQHLVGVDVDARLDANEAELSDHESRIGTIELLASLTGALDVYSVVDTDPNMAANSDALIPSQKAVKTRVDALAAARLPLSSPANPNLNTLLTTGVYAWTGQATTNYPAVAGATCAAADTYKLFVTAVGAVVLQELYDLTLGPSSLSFAWVRISANGGASWTGWVVTKAPPIGSVTRIGPNDATPASLYPGTTWTNVSYEEEGCVLRIGASALNITLLSGTPASFTLSVASGVPSISVASGGSAGYYPASTTIPLTLIGTCSAQWVGTATTNASGQITAVNTTTAGAGYLSSGSATGGAGANYVASGSKACIVYDGYSRVAHMLQGHNHRIRYSGYLDDFAGGGATNSNGANLERTGVSGTNYWLATAPISDGTDGGVISGPETTSAYSPGQKWRRTV